MRKNKLHFIFAIFFVFQLLLSSFVMADATVDTENDKETILNVSGEASQTQDVVGLENQNFEIAESSTIKDMIYENDFTDTTMDNRFVLTNAGGNTSISNEKLNITRTKNTDTTIADIYMNESKEPIKGLIGTEFIMARTAAKVVNQRFHTSNGYLFSMVWQTDGSITLTYNDAPGVSTSMVTTDKYASTFNVKTYFDTISSQFSLWINDKLVLKDKYAKYENIHDFVYLRFYLNSINYTTLSVDNLKVYYLNPSNEKIVQYDMDRLTDKTLLTSPYIENNVINSNLSLPIKGYYGSDITWESSNPEVIATDGSVKGPVDIESNTDVKLTARFEAYGVIQTKEYNFSVFPTFTSNAAKSRYDRSKVNIENITSQSSNALTKSLKLPYVGYSGGSIKWISNNNNVITGSGRVIRPRWDKPSANITLTADFGYGVTKDFNVTVLADEQWKDPMYAAYSGISSDEEFFGKWKDGAWQQGPIGDWIYPPEGQDISNIKWDPTVIGTYGRLDYSRPDLAEVEAAVKAGDYNQAKVALLKHMKNRNVSIPYNLAARDIGFANMVLSNVYVTQGNKYYQGDGMVNIDENETDEYEPISIPVKTSSIAKGGKTTYSINARYNENSEVLIASKQNENKDLIPKIEIIVNGQPRYYDVEADATIRAGKYADTNYGMEQDLKVKMFGDFLGDETYKALFRFDLSDLKTTDVVSDVRLMIYAKVNPSTSGAKSLLTLFEATNTWNENTVVFNSIVGYYYNYDGIPGGNDWNSPKGADVEYQYQSARFNEMPTLGTEYNYTKDEKYAYAAINRIMDFITNKGGPYNYITGTGPAWAGGTPLRGSYPRTLDTSFRTMTWGSAMFGLIQSPYMTPEAYTAILKNTFDSIDNLRCSLTAHNARTTDMMAIVQGFLYYPEFKFSDERLNFGIKELEDFMTKEMFFEDGSYYEATGGYSVSVYEKFITLKKLVTDNGKSLTPTLDAMMIKAGYYNSLLRGPNGANLAYGDEGNGQSTAQRFPDLVTWYGDRELEYIGSLGKKGVQPKWTSIQFPKSAMTFMRSDWTTRALYLFTQVRGDATHGHDEDNAITLIAYDKTLLTDQGIFTYTSSDPYAIWGNSTVAHNTVLINDTGSNGGNVGTINNWVTTNKYDFLTQTTNAYSGTYGDHKRTITFIKPRFWIISDVMTPKSLTTTNNYKQNWHMLPTANLTIDPINKTINSNFDTGANIILASPDKNIGIATKMGWYDYNYQQLAESPYGYFEKSCTGATGIDCVIVPFEGKNASVDAQRIDLGVDQSIATAMKFKTIINNEEFMQYYLLEYANDLAKMRTFDKYKTNGKVTLVREDKNGKWKEVYLIGGNIITTSSDEPLVNIGENEDMSFDIKGDAIYVNTADKTPDFSKVTIYTTDDIISVIYNDKALGFTKVGEKIILSNSTSRISQPKDPVQKGTVYIPETEPTPTPSPTPMPMPEPTPLTDGFTDIKIHWAKDAINDIKAKGIAKGDSNGKYNPDNAIKRAEMIAMVVRTLNLKESTYNNSFKDVNSSDWYANAVQTALDNNIISASDNFRPNDNITREEMCKIIVEAATKIKKLEEVPADFIVIYKDILEVSDWAKEYVKFATYYKYMSGMEDGSFSPLGNATRAEVAAVISRILK